MSSATAAKGTAGVTGTAAGASPAGGAATPAAGSGGFTSLIDALLQETATGAEAPTEFLEPSLSGEGEDESAGATEDPDDWLMSLALAQLTGLPAPVPSAGTASGGGDGQDPGGSGRSPAAEAASAPAAPLRSADEAAKGALALTAELTGDAVDASAIAASGTDASSAPAATGQAAGAGNTVNAWAAAAQRIAAAQDALPRPAGATPEGSLRESVASPRWKDELATHLTLMAVQGQQTGSLRLSPEHLGPLEVKITVNQDRTDVQFGAQHAETRAALQEALPRLREMFASAGLTLGEAGVWQQAPRQPPAPQGRGEGASGAASDGEPSPAVRHVTSVTHPGLLDTYA